MPLSEHEQRVLEQMEQALSAEDPRFASQMVGKSEVRLQRRRAALGILVALGGLGLVIAGVSSQQIWLGGLGFAAMVLGGAWAFSPSHRKPRLGTVSADGNVRPHTAHPSTGGKGKPGKPKGSGSFMDRMEQRWDKRREQGPF